MSPKNLTSEKMTKKCKIHCFLVKTVKKCQKTPRTFGSLTPTPPIDTKNLENGPKSRKMVRNPGNWSENRKTVPDSGIQCRTVGYSAGQWNYSGDTVQGLDPDPYHGALPGSAPSPYPLPRVPPPTAPPPLYGEWLPRGVTGHGSPGFIWIQSRIQHTFLFKNHHFQKIPKMTTFRHF